MAIPMDADVLRIVPTDPISWKEQVDRSVGFKMRARWARGYYACQNQLVPAAGTGLTVGDYEHLDQHLKAMASNACDLRNAAPAALLSAVMTTSRSYSTLASLHAAPHTQTSPNKPCLTLGPIWFGGWNLAVPAASRRSALGRNQNGQGDQS